MKIIKSKEEFVLNDSQADALFETLFGTQDMGDGVKIDKLEARHDSAALIAITEFANRLDTKPVRIVKYVHPKLLIPMICTLYGWDIDEYSDLVYQQVKHLTALMGVTAGFAKYYTTNF